MLKKVYRLWPQTAPCIRSKTLYRLHSFSTTVIRPTTTGVLEKAHDLSQSKERKESDSSQPIETKHHTSFSEDENLFEIYQHKKQNDPSQLTAKDYVVTGMYIQRFGRSYSERITNLQSLLRDVNTQMQSDSTLKGAFLKICNMLMYTYIRNKNLKNAKSVFEGLLVSGTWNDFPEIQVVSATTILNGIRELGTRADVYGTVNKYFHQEVIPLHERVFVTAIYVLDYFGDIKGCRYYFALMKRKGLATGEYCYRAMIQASLNAKDTKSPLLLLNEMKERNIKPSTASYSMVIRSLSDEKHKEQREQVYQELLASGVDINVSVFTAMGMNPIQGLDELARLNRLPNTRDYNAALGHLLRSSQSKEALDMYKEMHEKGVERDQYTYAIVMDTLLKNGDHSASAVFDLYEEMKSEKIEPDQTIYTCLLMACTKEKTLDKAMAYLKEMGDFNLRPNLHTFNAFLSVLAVSSNKAFDHRKMRETWLMMRRFGIRADTRSYNIYFSACSNIANKERAKGYFHYSNPEEDEVEQPIRGTCKYMLSSYRAMKAEDNPLAQPDFATFTILVKTLASSGYIRLAMQIYEDAKISRVKMDVSAYNEMMRGLEKGGKMSDIMSIWYDMKMQSVLPDNVSYEIVLEACEQLGLQESLATIRNQRKSEFDRLWKLSKKQNEFDRLWKQSKFDKKV